MTKSSAKVPTKPPTDSNASKKTLPQLSVPSSQPQTEGLMSAERKEEEESTPGKRGKISHASPNLKRKAEEEPEYEENEFPVQKKRARPNMRPAPEPEPKTPLQSVIDISSGAPSRAEADIAQTSSSDAAEPSASIEASIPVGCGDAAPGEELIDSTILRTGQRIVKKSTMKISRAAKTVPASDRTLRNRS
ncbi:hypothetical protein RhiJN_08069 [Ceratobasidium sp. AG-Ba]|nr:hypothetical protein RhiJN_08069 [Ceratobasidium sp. AG-Ba]